MLHQTPAGAMGEGWYGSGSRTDPAAGPGVTLGKLLSVFDVSGFCRNPGSAHTLQGFHPKSFHVNKQDECSFT